MDLTITNEVAQQIGIIVALAVIGYAGLMLINYFSGDTDKAKTKFIQLVIATVVIIGFRTYGGPVIEIWNDLASGNFMNIFTKN